MARQISGGLVQPAINSIAAHNETHRAVVALEAAKPHYDGSEWDTAGVEQVTASFHAAPTTLAQSIDVVNKIKALLNGHYTRHNSGGGLKVWAHKALDNVHTVSTTDMGTGSSYESTILTNLANLISELRADYELHRQNGGGAWHTSTDTINVLGGQPAITSFAEAATELNNLKAQYEAHRVLVGPGPVHGIADAVNTIAAANAVGTDIDSCITLANDLKAKYNAHRTQGGGVHAVNDTVNVVTTVDAGYPADLFTLVNEIRGDYEGHRTDVAYHEAADATNTIAAPAATTITTLIALAAELRTDIDAHFRFAPVSAAQRGV